MIVYIYLPKQENIVKEGEIKDRKKIRYIGALNSIKYIMSSEI